MRTSSHDRGSALVIAMILMVVLAVVGIAIVNRTTKEVDAVASKRHWDRAMSCAEGARQMLLSEFRAYGLDITQLTLQKTVGDQNFASGHYDSFQVATVQPAQGSPGGVVGGDAANRITKGGKGLGQKAFRFAVVCADSAQVNGHSTHQQEVEFLVNFGF